MFLIIQITAFKARWHEIKITGCEDYENTFARIKSDNLHVELSVMFF